MVSTALLLMIYLSFISLGLPDSLFGSAWPSMVTAMRAPLWGAGLVHMVVSCSTIISSLNSAKLIRRFGTGKLTAFSVALTALAMLGISFAPNYAVLLILAVPLGLGGGAVDTALNAYVALHCAPRHMSWLHCFWGIGTSVSPMMMSACLTAGWAWTSGYRMVALLQCVLSAALFATLGLWKRDGTQQEQENTRDLTLPQVFRLPGAKAGLLTFACYCAIESSLGLWAATFMVVARGIDAARAASYVSLFYLGITAGRAVSGFLTFRFSPKQLVRMGQALLILGAAMMFVPVEGVTLAGLALCGLGCAPIYPNIIQDTPVNYGPENAQAAVGAQMAMAYVGSTLMPFVFGWMAGILGYGILPVYTLAIAVLMAVMFGVQKRIVERKR